MTPLNASQNPVPVGEELQKNHKNGQFIVIFHNLNPASCGVLSIFEHCILESLIWSQQHNYLLGGLEIPLSYPFYTKAGLSKTNAILASADNCVNPIVRTALLVSHVKR